MKLSVLFYFLTLGLNVHAALKSPSESEGKETLSISPEQINEQLLNNNNRQAVIEKDLKKKAKVLSKMQNGGVAPSYFWEQESLSLKNRKAVIKILKIAIRKHMAELEHISTLNEELNNQLEWMSHEVKAKKDPIAKKPISKSKEVKKALQTISFNCSYTPATINSSSQSLLQDFGVKKDNTTGLEWNSLGWWIAQEQNNFVRSCHKGKVVFSGVVQGRGHVIMLEHTDGFLTIYANLAKPSSNIQLGQSIKTGQKLGKASEKLYFEVRQNGKAINPRLVFARQNLDILGLL